MIMPGDAAQRERDCIEIGRHRVSVRSERECESH